MSIYIDPIEKWEKSSESDGITKTKTVGKVENGFIIVTRTSGNRGEGEDKEYFDESKAFISETNPFEEMDINAGVKDLLDKF